MIKIFWLIVLVCGGIYGTGYMSLSDASVRSFLDQMEELTANGEASAICDLFAADISASVNDHTVRKGQFSGGKEALCEQVKQATAAYTLLRPTTTVMRENYKAERSWLHPWTVKASYTEHRSISIPRANIQQRTESDDEITLVKTFSGVKITRMQSEVWLEE